MKKLTRNDFVTKKVGNMPYLSFKGKNCEICIESGFGCTDIAVYDLKKDILEPKVTINYPVNILSYIEFYKEVERITNNFYKKWELK